MEQKRADARYRAPRLKVHHDFHYRPVKPFGVVVSDPSHFEKNVALDEAINQFVRYAIPIEKGVRAAIFDADGVIIIGYSRVKWAGLKVGFDAFRDHPLIHPLEYELAMKEASESRE